jgi:hypothetical protein
VVVAVERSALPQSEVLGAQVVVVLAQNQATLQLTERQTLVVVVVVQEQLPRMLQVVQAS